MCSPTIHVIDDDDSFLLAFSRLMRASGFTVKLFTRPEDFLADIPKDAAGCVISDLCMPGMSGLDLQSAMNRQGSTLPMIFLTGHADIPTTVTAMQQGAVDFLEKTAPKEKLIDAVKLALARDEAGRSERQQRLARQDSLSKLSTRERQVLALVVRGNMNKEIASELGIHERTVKLHRTSITTKLGVHSVAELTRLWMAACD